MSSFNRPVVCAALALTLAASVSGCDKIQKRATRLEQKTLQQAGVDVMSLPIWPPSSAGQYLAARVAVGNDDLETANKAYQEAIEAAPDETIAAYLAERALPVAIGAGDHDTALRLAKALPNLEQTATGQFSVLLQLRDAFDNENWDTATQLATKLRADGFGQFTKPLAQVWLLVGQKKFDAALAQLDQAEQKNPSLQGLFIVHRALVLEQAGRIDMADKTYRAILNNNFTLGGALAAANFFARQHDDAALKGIYDLLHAKLTLPVSYDNFVASFPFDKEKMTAARGYATSLFDLATVLQSENSSRLALLYARIAEPELRLYPTLAILLGDVAMDMHDYDQARHAFDLIAKDTLFYATAQLRKADAFAAENNIQAALDVLKPLAVDPSMKRQILTQMADLLRADKQYKEAVTAYTQIIDGIATPIKKDWGLFYARAICYETLKDTDKSEADLQAALKISPDQPEVLNYLGYSWADKSVNLEQAYTYIARAHNQNPEDPYITDSSGWVLYQLGYFIKAVTLLEQSVQQLPADPTINDHLGDAYWQVGRETEARFQWDRALKNDSHEDPDFPAKIAEKIKAGLPKKAAHNGPLPAVKTSQNLDTLLQRLQLPPGARAKENMTPFAPKPRPVR